MDKESTLKIDPHVHSTGSYDCNEPVDLLLDHVNEIDLDAVVITDHNTIEKSLEAAEKSEEYDDVRAIPGVEVSTHHGHLLAVGVEEKPEAGQPLDETAEKVREMGGAAIVPHPFQKTRHGARKKNINGVDAVEVYNSWLFTGIQNRRARRFAKKKGLNGVASSDAHSIGMIGRAYTEVPVERPGNVSRRDIVERLRNEDLEIAGRRAPAWKIFWYFLKATARKSAYFGNGVADKVERDLDLLFGRRERPF